MGWRFHRSIRLLPGVRVNLSRSGFSTSLGGRGATLNLGRKGPRATIGLPGSGLSYSRILAGGDRGGAGSPKAISGCGCVGLGVAGLMAIAMLSSGDPTPPIKPTAAVAGPASTLTVYVQPRIANCRRDPTTGAPVVARLTRARELALLTTANGWSQVQSDGTDCWVSSALLSPDPPVSAARAAELRTATGILGAQRTGAESRQMPPGRRDNLDDADCSCASRSVCTGPRGGRYCITSGGRKRYGV